MIYFRAAGDFQVQGDGIVVTVEREAVDPTEYWIQYKEKWYQCKRHANALMCCTANERQAKESGLRISRRRVDKKEFHGMTIDTYKKGYWRTIGAILDDNVRFIIPG